MSLFDIEVADAQVGYLNLKAARYPAEAAIKQGLEGLWAQFEPYADTRFRSEFAKQPDARFWEMYLTTRLLAGRKKIVRREQLAEGRRDEGPDICVPQRKRKIWIEAIAPDAGEPDNLDKVPNLSPTSIEEDVQSEVQSARRQVELRITSALLKKRDVFQRYRDKGLVADEDSCIVAISAGQFALQAIDTGLSHAVTAVYPFGQEYFELNPNDPRVVTRKHEYSAQIRRLANPREPIPRSAFQHPDFAGISGVIWSRRSIGNFLGQPDDFMYIHNHAADRPIPRRWFRWLSEFFPNAEGTTLAVRKRKGRK